MFSWVIWFPAPGSIPADVIKTTEPWWVCKLGRGNVSTAKAWESLLGRGNSAVTSFIVKSSVHSFISRWIRLRFGMCKRARNRDNAFALYAKWLSQPRKWNCSLRKVAIATAIAKLFTAQRDICSGGDMDWSRRGWSFQGWWRVFLSVREPFTLWKVMMIIKRMAYPRWEQMGVIT